MYLLTGYLVGAATILIIGPVLFTLLKATWQYGHKAGFAVEAGIMVSDIVVVVMCYFAASASSTIIDQYVPKTWIGIFGVLLLLALGVKYILQPGSSLMATVTTKADHPLAFFTRGLVINTLNPSVFVVWLTIIGNASKHYGYGNELIGFLVAAVFGIFSVDMIKIFTANKIKPYMTPAILDKVYRGIGFLLILFAFYVGYKTYTL